MTSPASGTAPSAVRTRIVVAATVLVSCAVAVTAGLLLEPRVPGGLPATSDVAGYPLARDFDVRRLRNVYLFWIAVVPLGALVLGLLFLRLLRRLNLLATRSPPSPSPTTARTTALTTARTTALTTHRSLAPPTTLTPTHSTTVWAVVARGAAIGTVLGIQAGGIAETRIGGSGLFWTLTGLCLGALGILVVLGWSSDWASGALAAASVCSVLGLIGLSRTTAGLTPDGVVQHLYPWLPEWLGLVLAIIAATWCARSMRHAAPSDVAHRAVVVLGGMVAVFALQSRLPGPLAPPDVFHNGEQLASATRFLDGQWPWRDFFAIHGITLDVLHGVLGFAVFERTYWGLLAGWTVVIEPLTAALTYALMARLLRHHGPAALLLVALNAGVPLVFGIHFPIHTRVILLPVALLLLIRFLGRPTWVWAGAACGAFVLLIIGTPESTYLLPGLLVVLPLLDWDRRSAGAPWVQQFPLTFRFGVCGLVASMLIGGALAIGGALDDFLFMYRTFAPDHDLTGGIPIALDTTGGRIAMYGSPIATLGVLAVGLHRRARGSVSPVDAAMLVLAVFNVFYYTKFLSRADAHVFHPWATSLPLIAYLVGVALDQLDAGLVNRPRIARSLARTGGILLCAALLLHPWKPTWQHARFRVDTISEQLRPLVNQGTGRLGYSTTDGALLTVVADVQYVLSESAGRPLTVFDFGNQPGLYGFLVDTEPLTRYPHVSMAIRGTNQQDLIDQLEERPPDLVAYIGRAYGLPQWDGIDNSVRHYDVAEWILRHYKPWLEVGGEVLLQRNDLTLPDPATVREAVAGTVMPVHDTTMVGTCQWYQLAERLAYDGGVAGTSEPLEAAAGLRRLAGWVVRDGRGPLDLAAVVEGRVTALERSRVDRADLADRVDLRFGSVVGFDLVVPFTAAEMADDYDVALVAIWADGTRTLVDGVGTDQARTQAAELLGARSADAGQQSFIDIDQITESADGRFELTEGSPVSIARAVLASATDASWLVLRSDRLSYGTTVQLGATLTDPNRLISAEARGGDDQIAIQVGACPQWYETLTDTRWFVSSADLAGATVALAPGPVDSDDGTGGDGDGDG